MGREVRKVPSDWQHPKDSAGRYTPLYDQPFCNADADPDDDPPDPDYYRPDWPESERTHFQIYETVSEGTPLSPPCASLKELARWYAEHGDPVWGAVTYEQALTFVGVGYAPSMVFSSGRVMSGVEFLSKPDDPEPPA